MSVTFATFLLALSFTIFVLYLIHKRRLREQYAILWLLFGLIMTVLSVSVSWLDMIAGWLNVSYPPSLLFLVGIIFCFVLILNVTIIVSKLTKQVIRLTQEIGLLEERMRRMEQSDKFQ